MIDPEIVRRIAAGSSRGLRELYERMAERIYLLHVRTVGDEHLAEDLTHDTFVQVAAKAHQFRGATDATGWILRIAGNLGRERMRTAGRRREILARARWDDPSSQAQPDPEDLIAVRAAVARLDEPARMVVLLHFVDGFTHREIGEYLGIAEGTSRARLSRALGELRGKLGLVPVRRSE